MDLHTRYTYDSVKVVCGLFLLLNLYCGQVFSKVNQTSNKPLNIVAILEPPYVMKDPDTGKFTGLMIDVLNKGGITIDHIDTPIHDTYGSQQNPGEFTGMIGGLVDGKYDLAVGPFNIRSKRAKHVTFSQPVLHHGYKSLYKLPKNNEWNFDQIDAIATPLKPFSPGLWCLLILTSVLASATLCVIHRFSPYENDVISPESQKADHSLVTRSWSNSLMYLLGSLSGRNVSVMPRSTSGRVLTAIWWFFSFMTVGAYIAGLVVVLFKSNPHLRTIPFATVDEMISQTEVKVLGVKNSGTYNYIANHKGHLEKKIYQYWKNNWDTVMVDTSDEAMKLLNEGDGKYAVFMSEDIVDYLASNEPCDKMGIGESVGDITVGFACQQGSTVCDSINHVILTLQEEGKMDKLRDKYFRYGCHRGAEIFFEGSAFFDTFGDNEPGLLYPDTISIRRFSGAFILLAIGFLLAMLVLVGEVVYSKRKGNIHHQLKAIARDEDAQRIQDHDFSQDPDV